MAVLSAMPYGPMEAGGTIRGRPQQTFIGENVKRIVVNARICSGCRACMVACVARHDGRFGTATARIQVTKVEHLGVNHPHVCRLCRRAPCVAACSTGALHNGRRLAAPRRLYWLSGSPPVWETPIRRM